MYSFLKNTIQMHLEQTNKQDDHTTIYIYVNILPFIDIIYMNFIHSNRRTSNV